MKLLHSCIPGFPTTATGMAHDGCVTLLPRLVSSQVGSTTMTYVELLGSATGNPSGSELFLWGAVTAVGTLSQNFSRITSLCRVDEALSIVQAWHFQGNKEL